jgi:hypothetical protein
MKTQKNMLDHILSDSGRYHQFAEQTLQYFVEKGSGIDALVFSPTVAHPEDGLTIGDGNGLCGLITTISRVSRPQSCLDVVSPMRSGPCQS